MTFETEFAREPAAPAPRVRGIFRTRNTRVIPGLPLTLGYTLFYLSALVLLPLAALALKAGQMSPAEFLRVISDPVVTASLRLTFFASTTAALINAVFGLIVAWVLVRYDFPFRRLFDAIIDFPFALPTAVAGLTFASLFLKDGWLGGFGPRLVAGVNTLAAWLGAGPLLSPGALDWLTFPYTGQTAGIVIVLVFVGLPFVVRTVQPVLLEWDPEFETAARSLGASPLTVFRRVIFPEILPAWVSGVALAFARAVGEYGSVIFIAANIPGKSQIAPLQIVTRLDDFQYAQAAAIGMVLLAISLLVLLVINGLESFSRRHERTA
ncbi:ABC transporter permease subunit [Rhodoblastus acidophilus]|uniref:ABC transporter permease subunit n=1 Tax=Rhodoblastus acidophilus TaxID=1074 RepID=A0A6N8DW23_RHOAC|nr:ABC transporter permease subunit [Rhodoblastus acidophilus]MCW2276576.1 sulfate transport system permease protein [Rhodoblastus acidophilus]MTV33373.1 ABC transporter permease subunit [Rhodoblastus acidophilus]